jgi:hypothetical protein
MSLASITRQAERLRAVPLPAVLRAAGAKPDRGDKQRWQTQAGLISVTGAKFFNWNRQLGGGGAIDLVIHLYGVDFTGAIAWLRARFTQGACPPMATTTHKQKLTLPIPNARALDAVKRYLRDQRRLSPVILDELIRSGNLYADAHANAVFLMRGKHNLAIGAELRGTGPRPWRGMAPGSRKDRGYFHLRGARVQAIVLCESAIDAISCFMIHPHACCLSTAGARPDTAWLPAIIRRGLPIYCGFDADPTGENMAAAMSTRYPAITRLRPPQHDWNDTLTATR